MRSMGFPKAFVRYSDRYSRTGWPTFRPKMGPFRWFSITNPVGMMKAGRVPALALGAHERLPQHADVPTIAEVGFAGMRAAQWQAAFAPSAAADREKRT